MSGPLLVVADLVTHFPIKAGLFRRVVGHVRAVDGVSFHLDSGETVGVVGESGCGKSTLGRSVLRLVEPDDGVVAFKGEDVLSVDKTRMRELRREMQMVFQDPFASLNPRLPVRDTVAEPLIIHGTAKQEARQKADELLEAVGMRPEHGNRYPHEFSGGQRQRVGIARALALDPSVVILDEPVSALDVSIQSQVINLLDDLQHRFGFAYLFIAHDLSVVRHVSDRMLVMYLGKVVEAASRADVYDSPAHPYTHALLSAVPVADPGVERKRKRIVLEGDLPNPGSPPTGCRFRTRCPIAHELCAIETPPAVDVANGHMVACHFPIERGETLLDRVAQLGRSVGVIGG
ncbi:MAG: dipeptide ABC transporter ATP-binding protein [Acidimicrobiia bacterium]|nr:dipeptide ABC transporter ATP-binding protein [Acidimicrobiia bacterium]MDH4306251.1 dipeptide ABC transporter ATP-binding protein [Acidimicrobiia bacterium]